MVEILSRPIKPTLLFMPGNENVAALFVITNDLGSETFFEF